MDKENRFAKHHDTLSQTLNLCTSATTAADTSLRDKDIQELNYFDWSKIEKLDLGIMAPIIQLPTS